MSTIGAQQTSPGFLLEWIDRRPARVRTRTNYCLFLVRVITLPMFMVSIRNGQLVKMDIRLFVPTETGQNGELTFREVDSAQLPSYIHCPGFQRFHRVSDTCGLIHCDDFWFSWPGTFKLEISLYLEGSGCFLGRCILAPFEVTMSRERGNMELLSSWDVTYDLRAICFTS
ncbi:hypothetical protein VTN77DRAFT_8060 [Rasamsonia byssochlamydoides]|uniref:uncharacterized protein n=1 Tax=Rasamsonia byssochlamydoides TaxID=89139 RepID=UPI00374339CF